MSSVNSALVEASGNGLTSRAPCFSGGPKLVLRAHLPSVSLRNCGLYRYARPKRGDLTAVLAGIISQTLSHLPSLPACLLHEHHPDDLFITKAPLPLHGRVQLVFSPGQPSTAGIQLLPSPFLKALKCSKLATPTFPLVSCSPLHTYVQRDLTRVPFHLPPFRNQLLAWSVRTLIHTCII